MPTFISDPPQFVYLVLGGFLVVTGALAVQKQDRRAAIPFAVAFLLMFLVFLLDKTNESPREEAVRRTHMMAQAADAKNPDAFVAHVADTFEYQTPDGKTQKATRDQLKKSGFWGMLKQHNAHIAVWDFSRENAKMIDENTIEIGFMAKGEAEGTQIPLYVKATFGKQSDGSMKMTAIRTFDAIDHTKPFPIPNFP